MASQARRILIQKLREQGLSRKILPEIVRIYFIKDLSSKSVNGVGAFVPAICRLELHYNIPRPGAGGDSRGMIEFINTKSSKIQQERPYIEMVVEQKSGPPRVTAFYNNGTLETKIVPRWKENQIFKYVVELCDSSGGQNKNRAFYRKVVKGNGSKIDKLLPHWDPFHADQIFRP